MELIERFRYIMKLNSLSASAFADEIGVQRSSISHILSGRNKPSLEFIQKVLKRYPKVDANWLISGTTVVQEERIRLEDDKAKSSEKKEEDSKIVVESSGEQVAKGASIKTESSTDGKAIEKILIFYRDSTFEEFSPRN